MSVCEFVSECECACRADLWLGIGLDRWLSVGDGGGDGGRVRVCGRRRRRTFQQHLFRNKTMTCFFSFRTLLLQYIVLYYRMVFDNGIR